MALFTLGEYTIKATRQVGRQLKTLTNPITSAVRALSVLLFSHSFSPLMKDMLRRKSQPYATTIKCQEIIEIIPGASTLRTNTTTSTSSQVSGRVLALVAISGVPVSPCKRKWTATVPIGPMSLA